MNLNAAALRAALAPVNGSGYLLSPLVTICKLFGIDPDQPLADVRQDMSARWIDPGKERWEMPEVTLDDRCRRAIFWDCIFELPLYHRIRPTCDRAGNVLVTGSTLRPSDRKNAEVVDLWEKGLGIGRIVHLGADRVLKFDVEGFEVLAATQPGGLPVRGGWYYQPSMPYHTEDDMLRVLWQRSVIPSDMMRIPVDFVTSTRSTGYRAHSGDAYGSWFESCRPDPGVVVLMSINPHGPFQYWDAVCALEPKGFEVHLAAPSAQLGPQKLDYFLGALPRWLRAYLRAQELRLT